jgi:hypothetical protein
MTTKADYTDDEWVGIVRAPILAGGYIAVSDMSTLGMFGEMKGLFEAITGHPVPDAAAPLITEVVAAIKATEGSKDKLPMPQTQNSEKQAAQLLNQLGLDLEALDRKAAPDESKAFKGWVLGIAQATAEASREGGFLGIGSVRVSEQEEDALATLRREMGLY